MVYVLDEGSVFDVPMNRIWEYLRSQTEHEHKAMKRINVEIQGDNVVLVTNEVNAGGSPVRNRIKMTIFPPFGFTQEFLEGPMAGTKAFQYYISKGDRTGVRYGSRGVRGKGDRRRVSQEDCDANPRDCVQRRQRQPQENEVSPRLPHKNR